MICKLNWKILVMDENIKTDAQIDKNLKADVKMNENVKTNVRKDEYIKSGGNECNLDDIAEEVQGMMIAQSKKKISRLQLILQLLDKFILLAQKDANFKLFWQISSNSMACRANR